MKGETVHQVQSLIFKDSNCQMPFSQLLLNNKGRFTGYFLIGLIPLIFSSVVTTLILDQYASMDALSLSHWIVLFSLSIFTMALALTPSTFIAIVSGFFLGWQAVPMMLPAYMLASVSGYLIGQWLDGGKVLDAVKSSPKVYQTLENLNQNNWKLMFLIRLSPVLPFSLMNLLMPAINMPLNVFLVAGFVGMLPRTLLSIWIGNQAADLMGALQGQGNSELIIIGLLIMVSVVGLVQIFVRAFRKALT